ncbi:hypothetical protein DCAR_0933878 [Daucus carota subsp. sativus]|uniref:Vacuole membrane protein KMS1 n=2 Tax=Daucus carota subsp. sativus TaxID=79200 RepID=A0AAF1BC96_DAUCS|nr:hypothetical protein DCAR_0933878 [Daucus carota subsp. sativus]
MGAQSFPYEKMPSSSTFDSSVISGLHERHKREIELLTLTTQPIKTLKLFLMALIQYLERPLLWIIRKCRVLMLLGVLVGAIVVATDNRTRGKHVTELVNYLSFGFWWLALGVASSIGLGTGLHTFVLYLGPHIALFTMKAMQCGRVDLKNAPYDTIQLRSTPSWLDKDCSEYGPPMYSSPHSRVPLTSILHQVQLEAILWGIGTALGELPPYFISKAACISGDNAEGMKDLASSENDDKGFIGSHLKQMKQWLLSHSQHLNFFTILILASVPNPLFDLAGIMCGQFGIPFWKFFAATVTGKAIVKTHIQTAFIISICNNQLLELVEMELVWMLSFIPGFASFLPSLIAKLHIIKEKYMASSAPVSSNIKMEKWELSIASIWNTVVWLVLINFTFQIITATAQSYLKNQQEEEIVMLKDNIHALNQPIGVTENPVCD